METSSPACELESVSVQVQGLGMAGKADNLTMDWIGHTKLTSWCPCVVHGNHKDMTNSSGVIVMSCARPWGRGIESQKNFPHHLEGRNFGIISGRSPTLYKAFSPRKLDKTVHLPYFTVFLMQYRPEDIQGDDLQFINQIIFNSIS